MSCKICHITVDRTENFKIFCGNCGGVFHGGCVSLQQGDLDYYTKERIKWNCKPCEIIIKALKKNVGIVIKPLDNTQSAACELTIENILKSINQQLNVLGERLDSIENKLLPLAELEKENTLLKTKLESANARIGYLEDINRSKNFVIHGIPVTENENITKTVVKTINALGVTVTECNISECYRFKSTNCNTDTGILVSLNSKRLRDLIIEKRRQLRKTFTLSNIGMNGDTVIYINDHISKHKSELFKKAKDIRKAKQYKFVWMRNNNIMMRKQEGAKIIYINTAADFEKL